MKKMLKSLGFAVLIAVIAFSAMLITGCEGDSSENTDNSSPSPPPTATFAELALYASSWGENRAGSHVDYAEQWETRQQIKLSHFFSSYKPKQGDVLSFKISGVSDKALKYIRIQLGECLGEDWSTYRGLGASRKENYDIEVVSLTSSPNTAFTDILINVPIDYSTNPNAAIYANLVNLLWEKSPLGKYLFNSGETLPVGYQRNDVMATISNFKISLDKIDSTHRIDNNHGWNVWRDRSSTATETHSISDDGICTVTIGGTPEKQESGAWNAWKIVAYYDANVGRADTRYEYKFEAWTQSGSRNLHIQYYGDNNDEVYLGDTISITETRKTYTIYGESLPKSGKHIVNFQLADQIGTVNLKILEIKEYQE